LEVEAVLLEGERRKAFEFFAKKTNAPKGLPSRLSVNLICASVRTRFSWLPKVVVLPTEIKLRVI
jgi:hypothetical protein